jgi:hypothetical protein
LIFPNRHRNNFPPSDFSFISLSVCVSEWAYCLILTWWRTR